MIDPGKTFFRRRLNLILTAGGNLVQRYLLRTIVLVLALAAMTSPIVSAHEGENHGIRMQRTQPAEGGKRQIEIQSRPEQLAGYEQSGTGADQSPDGRRDGEGADDPVVVFEGFNVHGEPLSAP